MFVAVLQKEVGQYEASQQVHRGRYLLAQALQFSGCIEHFGHELSDIGVILHVAEYCGDDLLVKVDIGVDNQVVSGTMPDGVSDGAVVSATVSLVLLFDVYEFYQGVF